MAGGAPETWDRYHLLRRDDVQLLDDPALWSRGSRRAELLGSHTGTVHMALALVSLELGGVDLHVHSYEESFFVLDGSPILCLDGRRVRLRPGACGVVPVGMPHAWQEQEGRGPASWVEMATPRRRDASQPPDTFVLGSVDDSPVTDLDLRDPRNRHLFLLGDEDMDLDRLGRGAAVSAPTVSASMATAALAYSGITVKMLVDQRLDAQLGTMFMVAYEPGGVAHPHDHPFEESYYMLEGEVDVVADGDRYTLKPGDVFWTGVGCIHAFHEVQGKAVRWLETSSPQPPGRHSYRFERDWEYLATRLREPG